jgi:hypothetical protein
MDYGLVKIQSFISMLQDLVMWLPNAQFSFFKNQALKNELISPVFPNWEPKSGCHPCINLLETRIEIHIGRFKITL